MKTRSQCVCCNSENIKDIINLGWHPFADTFIPKKSVNELENVFPLICSICLKCKNIQLKYITDAFERYNNFEYSYTSSNSNFSKSHWDNFFKESLKLCNLNENSYILEIGCNDSYLLKQYLKISKNLFGLDASEQMVNYSKKKYKLNVFHNLFDRNIVSFFKRKKIKFNLIVANNVFNHMNNPSDCLENISKILDKKGKFIFEVPYWMDTIKNYRYDQIYHEHVTYFTVTSIFNLLKLKNFKIDHISIENYHGKSLRVVASRGYLNNKHKYKELINSEKKYGLFDIKKYILFTNDILRKRNKLVNKVIKLKMQGNKIIFIGAAAKSNTFINYHMLDYKLVNYITDTSKSKIGKLTPMSRIEIKHDNCLKYEKKAYVMILIWNMQKIIKQKLNKLNRNLNFL